MSPAHCFGARSAKPPRLGALQLAIPAVQARREGRLVLALPGVRGLPHRNHPTGWLLGTGRVCKFTLSLE